MELHVILFLNALDIFKIVNSEYMLLPYWEENYFQKVKFRPWYWERLKAKGEGRRGWNGWMASPPQWTWTWASSKRQRRTGKPGVLQSTGLQRAGHNRATEQQQLDGMMQLNGITAAPPPVSQTDIGVGHQLHTATPGSEAMKVRVCARYCDLCFISSIVFTLFVICLKVDYTHIIDE